MSVLLLNLTSTALSRFRRYVSEGCTHYGNIGRFSLLVISRHGFTLFDIDHPDSYAALFGIEKDYFNINIHIGYYKLTV